MTQPNDFGQQQAPAPLHQSWQQQPGQGVAPAGGQYGAPVAAGQPGGFPAAYKDSTAAWLLWFFLGYFGGHQFYLGNTKRGVIYLVTTLVSLLLSVVFIGLIGFVVMFVFWIIDATQMSAKLQEVNSRIFAANRAAGLA